VQFANDKWADLRPPPEVRVRARVCVCACVCACGGARGRGGAKLGVRVFTWEGRLWSGAVTSFGRGLCA